MRWAQILESEQDNLRAAFKTSLRKNSSINAGLKMAGMLHWFWLVRSQFTEGRVWLDQFLSESRAAQLPLRAQGYLTAGFLDCWQGNFGSARSSLEKSLELFHQLNDKHGVAFSLHGLGFAANGLGEHAQAGSLFQESLETAREIDDKWLISFALHFLAIGTSFQGDLDRANTLFTECIDLMKSGYGNLQGTAFSLFHLGRIAWLKGNFDLAYNQLMEALKLFWQVGDRRGLGYSLSGLANLALAQEEVYQAARLFGAVDSIREDLGTLLEEILHMEYERSKAVTRELIGEEDYQSSWSEGESTPLDQLIQNVIEGAE